MNQIVWILNALSFLIVFFFGLFSFLVGCVGSYKTAHGLNRVASKPSHWILATTLVVVGASVMWWTAFEIGWSDWMSYD